MARGTRTGDLTLGMGSHGLPCCPHVLTGVRLSGASSVNINGRGASRAGVDIASHSCPHCAINLCLQGSGNVLVNGVGLHRVGDLVTEFCGTGQSVTGSPDVEVNG
jgi:uncharacterized Zn-binding protein involved in type VI secretion